MHQPFLTRLLGVGLLLAIGAAVLILRLPPPVAGQIVYGLAFLTVAGLVLVYLAHHASVDRLSKERRRIEEASRLHLATVEALARAIDAKDQGGVLHTRRLQLYASRLAEAANLSWSEVEGVRTAALLHNIGKLAVPEHILSKPGPLTPAEFQRLRVHPEIGAEIVGGVPFPYSVAPIIRSHHERWDGQGYPEGLAAEKIPIGARILTIARYYETLTAERSHQKTMNHAGAIGLLRHESGRALDPRLVEIFIPLIPSMIDEFAALEPTGGAGAGVAADRLSDPPQQGTMQRALEQIAQGHRENYAVYEIAQSMGTSLGVSDTMAVIAEKLAHTIPWSACALFLPDTDANDLRCSFSTGVDGSLLVGATLRMDLTAHGWGAGGRCVHPGADRGVSIDSARVPKGAVYSALVCPLMHAGELIGAIVLYHSAPHYFNDDHCRVVGRVAEQAGAVIHNSIVFDRTQADSLTDALTSLPNRRSLSRHLTRELARADRLGNNVGLLMLDLDNLKVVNDSYGHLAGDQALSAVASVLKSVVRPYDLCVRFGGDEFVIVIGECSRDLAEAKRRELQDRVGEIELDVEGGRIRLSASAGAAVFPDDGGDADTLIATADAKMYADKAARHHHVAELTSSASRVPL